ncbi:replication-relaxation family protein [Phytohabitans rumicis]|nr:replication-relaxation family protein [Phytohabitans rumicis]
MSDPVLRVQSQLTDRDHILLGWLADHGVLTSFQIAHALFPSTDYAQDRLRKLITLGVLDRFRPQKPDGGSYPYHYVLAQLGVEVVAAQRGEELPRKDAARRRRWHLTNRANLPHKLGTNQFFIDLAGYARTHTDAELRLWWPESACRTVGPFMRADASKLTHFFQPRIRPDGYAIWVEHGVTVSIFVEYDTGTEQLGVLVDKLHSYHDLFNAIGQVWPVLFWLHSADRERNLRAWLADTRLGAIAVTGARDHAALTGRSPAEAVWTAVHSDGERLRLADLARLVVDRAPGGAT